MRHLREAQAPWCPECGRYGQDATVCTAERFRWDEDDPGHHCTERGPHEVHRCREHGCLWTEATSGNAGPAAKQAAVSSDA